MVRWQPGARERLQGAALQLFADQGFERTTVAEIADAAGLTERTFFRHFADKREVLFAGQEFFEQVFVDAVASAPRGSSPLDLLRAALGAADTFFTPERRGWSRTRQTVIDGEGALQERELLKLARLAVALTAAMQAQGVAQPRSAVAAETAVRLFHLSFQQWIAPGETRSIHAIGDELVAELRALAA